MLLKSSVQLIFPFAKTSDSGQLLKPLLLSDFLYSPLSAILFTTLLLSPQISVLFFQSHAAALKWKVSAELSASRHLGLARDGWVIQKLHSTHLPLLHTGKRTASSSSSTAPQTLSISFSFFICFLI